MADARVDRALCICTTMEEFGDVHALALAYDNFWSTVGVHPDNEGVQEPSVERPCWPTASRVVAIGETGLDYYGMEDRGRAAWLILESGMRTRFRTHIRAARACAEPLIIHTPQCVGRHIGHP